MKNEEKAIIGIGLLAYYSGGTHDTTVLIDAIDIILAAKYRIKEK